MIRRLHSTNYPKYKTAYENLAARLREESAQAKDAFEAWVYDRMLNRHTAHDGKYCAVTLTCKQARKTRDGGLERLTEETLSATIGKFLTLLNKDVYGKAYRRFGKQLKVVSAIERGKDGRLHAHLLLEIPRCAYADTHAYFEHVTRLWTSLQWARRVNEVKPAVDEYGWLTYITKEMTWKPDTLDLMNLHL